MKKRIFLLVAILFVVFSAFTIQHYYSKPDYEPIVFKKGDDYQQAWNQIDSLEAKGLPKSALKAVYAIYKDAKKHRNIPQVLKALLYEIKIVNYSEEDGLLKAIQRIEQEIKQSESPVKQILHTVNATMYQRYYQKYSWKIHQRTPLFDDTSEDIATWDVKRIHRKIIEEYQMSLSEANTLQRISLETIYPILSDAEGQSLNFEPTLYDFIADYAVSGLISSNLEITKPINLFKVDDVSYWDDAEDFVDLEIVTKDSSSVKWNALKTLQNWLQFRLDVENPVALLHTDLYRLKKVHQMSDAKQKDSLYLNALMQLEEQFEKLPEVAYVQWNIAELMQQKAQRLKSNIKQKDLFKQYNEACIQRIDKIRESYKTDSVLSQKCDYLMSVIERPSISFTSEAVILPHQNFPIQITSGNVKSAKLSVFKVTSKQLDRWRSIYGDNLLNAIRQSEKVSTQNINLSHLNDYQIHTSDYILSPLEKGRYALLLESDFINGKGASDVAFIQVSELSLLQKHHDGRLKIEVLNRANGKAIAGAKIKLYETSYSYQDRKTKRHLIATLTSDKSGQAISKQMGRSDLQLSVEYQGDVFEPNERLYVYPSIEPMPENQTYFFLDRAIYRPGQTVYFKAILLQEHLDSKRILSSKDIRVDLMDVNYQKISSLNLKTNEYGSVSGSFVLPQNLLNGRMTLQTKYGSQQFRVEEYKRPKFEVKIDEFKEAYRLNEKVAVKGLAKGFAGYLIANSDFKYRVVRKSNSYWRWNAYTPDAEIANGTGKTDENGAFEFNFKAIPEDNMSENMSYSYHIEVDVTDISGETRSAEASVNIGRKVLVLEAQLPDYLLKNKMDSVSIKAFNLNGEEHPTKINIELYEMQSASNLKKRTYWYDSNSGRISPSEWTALLPDYQYQKEEDKKGKSLLKSVIDTRKEQSWQGLKDLNLKQGVYGIQLTATDVFGQAVESFQTFTVVDSKSSQMPKVEKLLFLPLNNNLEPGQTAKILVGSSFKKQLILLEIDKPKGNRTVQKIHLSNKKKVIEIPVDENDRGNFKVSVSLVRNNRVYQASSQIKTPYTNKALEVKFETFRNKIYPGQKEEWRVKIRGAKGEKVASEFLASMYDASLDAFVQHSWSFDILNYFGYYRDYSAEGFYSFNARNVTRSYTNLPNPHFTKPTLNWFGFNSYGIYRNARGLTGGRFLASKVDADIESEIEVVEENIAKPLMDKSDAKLKNEVSQVSKKPKPKSRMRLKVRKNFNETAFFYPQLKTDAEGNVIFSFTMPESLTKWNFQGFAYTKDLKFGFLNQEIITQKDLMVEPNAPRFFREDDELYLPIKIVNLTDKTIQARTNVQFYDAISGKNLNQSIILDMNRKPIEILANQSGLLKVHLKVPRGVSAIRYKVVSSSGQHADGEERIIPVLSNRMLVTETMPMPIRGKGTKTFRLDKLLKAKSSTLSHYNYTIEMTSNPAWYAVQALPYLMEYPFECAEQTFSRYYSNALASHIANSNPKIKAVFEAWKQEGNSEAFLSNLEKNKELKNIFLEASPWVNEAKSESEQKRRIATLFDLNQLAFSQQKALQKLQKMQNGNGSWSWFPGMREDRYITQLIVSGLAKLHHLKVIDLRKDYQIEEMVHKALMYLDDQIAEDYTNLKKEYKAKRLQKASHTSAVQVQYLWMRSFLNDMFALPKFSEEAYQYYAKNSRQYWTKHNFYLQAMIGLTSLRDKDSKLPKVEHQILKSLKEFAIHNEEMGMYWKREDAYYWSQAPIERQAMIIALFKEMGEDVEDLKVWLLKQKQTQHWKTTRATADAIYALLLSGNNDLLNTDLVEIQIAGQPLDYNTDTKVQAGTGYFKKSWSAESVRAEMGEVQLKKNSKGVAWGAVYWQYFEDIDKVSSSGQNLKIEKKMFVERVNDSGITLKPIENESIKPGDKLVVRMVIRSDRDLEYVHLKDMRASGLEPLAVLSGYRWKSGLGYYQSVKDASMNFFIDYLRKGTYVFEYPLMAVHSGDFSNGIATVQCMYAPEFSAHSDAVRLKVGE